MTDLERIEIEGFKGLESISFEPSGINLITGRNNTGKTTLIEGIGLLYDPTIIQKFSNNIDRVINVNYDESHVTADTAQMDKTLHLRQPNEVEVGQYFTTVSSELLFNQSVLFEYVSNAEKEMIEKASDKLESSIQSAFQEKADEDDLQELKNEFLVISLDGRQYPYFSGGKKSEEIMAQVYNEIIDEFGNDENLIDDPHIDDYRLTINGAELKYEGKDSMITTSLRPEASCSFLKEPSNTSSISFIESTESTERPKTENDEKDAVKIDDIGDYIKEKNLVDNLKTFNLDYLVFEKEDGEKYSVPYDFMGDGFKSIIGLLWELLDNQTENKIVLIEEPENHMHPGYVSELVHFLIDLARDEDIQFFITTHDHDFIKDFFMDMPDEKREYLEEEFSLVKMDDFGADVLNYEDAEHHLKDLHLDLRGI